MVRGTHTHGIAFPPRNGQPGNGGTLKGTRELDHGRAKDCSKQQFNQKSSGCYLLCLYSVTLTQFDLFFFSTTTTELLLATKDSVK